MHKTRIRWLVPVIAAIFVGAVWAKLPPATDEQKAKARKVASLASRTNFALSIPLVLCMGSASHGLPF